MFPYFCEYVQYGDDRFGIPQSINIMKFSFILKNSEQFMFLRLTNFFLNNNLFTSTKHQTLHMKHQASSTIAHAPITEHKKSTTNGVVKLIVQHAFYWHPYCITMCHASTPPLDTWGGK